MDFAPGVAAALRDAGRSFGPARPAPPEPRWGALYAALDAAADPHIVVAVELIYEGYLLHYRESRAVLLEAGDLPTRLLAGDFFYARGLRGFAARGDADAVGLLARLMAACSCLRSSQAPFAADDALWAYTMGGLAAQHAGAGPAVVDALFDEVDAALGGPDPADVAGSVERAAGRLGLPDAEPLVRALAAVSEPASSGPASAPGLAASPAPSPGAASTPTADTGR